MSISQTVWLASITAVVAPLAGGMLHALDRKLTARLQSRCGPSWVQPFYDTLKLFGKQSQAVNQWQPFFALLYLFGAAASMMVFVLGGDLLVLFFLSTLTVSFLVMGALSSASPYSRIGADREMIQALIYEPMLLVALVGVYHATGSFDISAVRNHPQPLLLQLPMAYPALFLVFLIKMHKSPFDFSAAHHAHQELVQGILTEYAGPVLAFLEIGRWLETLLLLLIISLFWNTGVGGAVFLPAATFAAAILLDNIAPRLVWRWALRWIWISGLVVICANLAWLYWT